MSPLGYQEMNASYSQVTFNSYAECVQSEWRPKCGFLGWQLNMPSYKVTSYTHHHIFTFSHARPASPSRVSGSQMCPRWCISLAFAAVHFLTASSGGNNSGTSGRQQQSRLRGPTYCKIPAEQYDNAARLLTPPTRAKCILCNSQWAVFRKVWAKAHKIQPFVMTQ